METLSFPPYTLTGGVAYQHLSSGVFQHGDQTASTLDDIWDEDNQGELVGLKIEELRGEVLVRRPLDPTPDNYAILQTAWLSHFSVGVGSRVRVVGVPSGNKLGWSWTWVPPMNELVGQEFTVRHIHENAISIGTAWVPFHVLAPVEEVRLQVPAREELDPSLEAEIVAALGDALDPAPVPEQPKVEVIELTGKTREKSVPRDVTHVVIVDPPVAGTVYHGYCRSKTGGPWFHNGGDYVEHRHVIPLYDYARAATLAEIEAFKARQPHAPTVPEGQGEVKQLVCRKCGKTAEENRSKYCGDGSDKDNEHEWERRPASPTPAIERGEDFMEAQMREAAEKWMSQPVPNWFVQVQVNGQAILCISEQHLSGKKDMSDEERACVRAAAENMTGFIGKPTPTPSAGQDLLPYDEEGGQSGWVIAGMDNELTRLRGEVADRDRLMIELTNERARSRMFEDISTTLTADLGRAREENADTRDAIRLVIGMWNNRPWHEVSTGDVDSYCNEIKRLKALRPAAKDDEGGGE